MAATGHSFLLILFAMTFFCSFRLSQHVAVAAFSGGRATCLFPYKNTRTFTRRFMSHQAIQSTKSATVKHIQALLKKSKKRQELGITVVEGPRMVMDLLENDKTKLLVQQVLVSSDKQEWIQRLTQQHPSLWIQEGTPEVLTACSDTVTPQGIMAIVSIPEFELKKPKFPLYLVLDGVSDPGNMGTLLRSSVAVGAAGVVLLPQCCDSWNPKAVRSAMGCTFQVPILSVDSIQKAGSILGVETIYAATMEECGAQTSIPHYDVDWTATPSALVIGSEGNGLSDAVRKAVADGTIQATHVPMEAGIESLNAAVCGSVIMFEFLRQCRNKP
jgi:TrmH family RNA methyltransferase